MDGDEIEPIGENESELVDVKPWWASKIIWAQIIAGVAAIASALGFKVLEDPATQMLVVGGIVGIVTIVLRVQSETVIKTKKRSGQ